jgi:hypothetical protein
MRPSKPVSGRYDVRAEYQSGILQVAGSARIDFGRRRIYPTNLNGWNSDPKGIFLVGDHLERYYNFAILERVILAFENK